MNKYFLIITACLLLLFKTTFSQTPAETEDQRKLRMKWWTEARFGMFIHWGIYSVPAGIYNGKEVPGIGEWIMNKGKIPMVEYQKYAAQFNPVKFDADKFVSLAKQAGMKYIVITSKHHDGFAMFKSNASDFNIVDATPYKKDVIKEMARACNKYDIKFGLYYSQAQDWNHPGGAANGGYWDPAQNGDMDQYIDKVAVPQMKEILTKYGPISVLWFDTPTGMTPERAAKIHDVLKLQPNIITNNRLGGGFSGDLETPEQYIPATGYPGRNWETCMTMNDTWGYKQNDKNFKSTKTLIQNLIDIASKGGNYLLNVGPTAEGLIPDEEVTRLQQIGKWMAVNGNAIYGTYASPFSYLNWGRATYDGKTLYLHVFKWPANGILNVPLQNVVNKAYLLANKTPVKVKPTADGIRLSLPATAPDSIASVIALEITGYPVTRPVPSENKAVKASSEAGADNSAAKAIDGNPVTKWVAAKTDTTATLEVDLGARFNIDAIAVQEGAGKEQTIKEYRLEYKDGDQWKTVYEGKKIGRGILKEFAPVNAQVFRLNITKASPGIQIQELSLFDQ
ncbi:alpha-L-fucosidase [uncultured Mucilaginibacter sp.]|uniref:alpha-L-fucosidase n=1 Tax=uncultured Mucilaginibacter sp. TaxID=797541 RepID=UPI0025E98C40|nr:alpha-L-fucosidase [uncultured Mucilaginibacter sp.]